MEKRLTELESRVAFQDDTIQKLNDVVTAQQGRIDKLVEEIQLLTEQVRLLSVESVSGPDSEPPPPHY